MKNILKQTGLLASLFLLSATHAAPMKDSKFYFDGTKQKHPVKIEMRNVVYKAKGMDVEFMVYNNSDTGIDFSQASLNIHSGNRDGYITKSDFDALRLQPKSKRVAYLSVGFDEVSRPTFLQEREKGTSTIKIDNVKTFNNRKLSGIVLKNY